MAKRIGNTNYIKLMWNCEHQGVIGMAHTPSMINNTHNRLVQKARVQTLDVIRGLAILGILAVNADGFAAPISASLNPPLWPYPNDGVTAVCYWLVDAFFHDKFVTLFSMLFGVSLFLVGGERGDSNKERILWRRLAVMFAFAMLHGFGIWWGDILSLYAVTGVIMVFCRSWRPKALLLIGIVLYSVMALRQLPIVISAFAPPIASIHGGIEDKGTLLARKASVASTINEAKSSWNGAYRVNTRSYLRVLSGDPWLVPSTLGLMMIGLSLFKTGWLAGRSSLWHYKVVGAVGVVALGILAWALWEKDVNGAALVGGKAFEVLVAPFVSLSYAAGLVLLLKVGAAPFLSPLAAAGRMAFTNYLTQSLIMTSIFYGGRGSLMGAVNRPALWVVVIVVWFLQLIWSPFWLSRFEMGPFEWAWRCLTYGRRVPFLKAV